MIIFFLFRKHKNKAAKVNENSRIETSEVGYQGLDNGHINKAFTGNTDTGKGEIVQVNSGLTDIDKYRNGHMNKAHIDKTGLDNNDKKETTYL